MSYTPLEEAAIPALVAKQQTRMPCLMVDVKFPFLFAYTDRSKSVLPQHCAITDNKIMWPYISESMY